MKTETSKAMIRTKIIVLTFFSTEVQSRVRLAAFICTISNIVNKITFKKESTIINVFP